MKKKMSKKEQNKPVVKGFLEDYTNYLERKKYVTESSLEIILENKDYVTKDWTMDMFQMFEKRISEDFARQTNALVEIIRHENRLIVEALIHRIERIENYIGLPYP